MIEQLLLHGVGDYMTQNGWMALNKKKKGLNGFLACLTHCSLYAAPFLLIGSWLAVLVIFLTHFAVDRTKIVEHIIAFRDGTDPNVNFGFPADRPMLISFWLYVFFDNMIHLLCNYAALSLL